jgi:hypothetical protein
MSKSVVVLAPDGSYKQDVKRSNLLSLRNFCRLLEPLYVLVNHRVDDVNEGLVAIKETVATSQKITL